MTTTLGGVTVRWDGTYDPATLLNAATGVSTAVVAPEDFKGVEVQVSESSGFTGTFADVRGPLLTSARVLLELEWRGRLGTGALVAEAVVRSHRLLDELAALR